MSHDHNPNANLLWIFLLGILLGFQSYAQDSRVIDNLTVNGGNATSAELRLPAGFVLNDTVHDPVCYPYLSHDLTVASCEDALAQVPNTEAALLDPFGDKLLLPARFSSSDGKCAIELSVMSDDSVHVAITGRSLHDLVRRILDRGVRDHGGGPSGGSIKATSKLPPPFYK
ncbi:hypothetical protein ACLMJK_003953 [Lecanora helva]